MEMFWTCLRGGKAFAAEQKIRELKTRIANFFSKKMDISPRKIIEMSTTNMNIRPSKKYGFSREEVEKRALESERFRTVYNMHRLEKTHKLNLRQDRYDKKSMLENEKRENLNIGEKVYVLVEKIKKKSSYSTMIEEKKRKYSFIIQLLMQITKKARIGGPY